MSTSSAGAPAEAGSAPSAGAASGASLAVLVERLKNEAQMLSQERAKGSTINALLDAAAALETLEREKAEATESREWEPIETAPRDGTKIDLWAHFPTEGSRRYTDAWFDAEVGTWRISEFYHLGMFTDQPRATHWMRRPLSPGSKYHLETI